MLESIRNYNNITIVYYPGGAGGKFLICTLALNDKSVFQEAVLTEYQLEGKFTVEKKVEYIKDRLENSKKIKQWTDFDTGCTNFFGFKSDSFYTTYFDILELRINSAVRRAIKHQKQIFAIAHSTQELETLLSFWHNANVIIFENYKNFISQRKHLKKEKNEDLKNYWNIIKGNDWPELPPESLSDLENISPEIKKELHEVFHDQIYCYLQYEDIEKKLRDKKVKQLVNKLKDRVYIFDVEYSYSSPKVFFDEMKKCANWLSLPVVVPETEIQSLFFQWKKTITNI